MVQFRFTRAFSEFADASLGVAGALGGTGTTFHTLGPVTTAQWYPIAIGDQMFRDGLFTPIGIVDGQGRAPCEVDNDVVLKPICSIRTDGTPAPGEFGFVTWHYPATLEVLAGAPVVFDGDAIDPSVPQSRPAATERGDVQPVVLGPDAGRNLSFTPWVTVAATARTRCSIDTTTNSVECVVKTDDTPSVGESTRFSLRYPGKARLFSGEVPVTVPGSTVVDTKMVSGSRIDLTLTQAMFGPDSAADRPRIRAELGGTSIDCNLVGRDGSPLAAPLGGDGLS